MQALVKLGADVNAQDGTFCTPLLGAASMGHNDCVQALILAAGGKLDIDLPEMLGKALTART